MSSSSDSSRMDDDDSGEEILEKRRRVLWCQDYSFEYTKGDPSFFLDD